MTKKDWHPADIVAALHKRGTSLAKLSREAGLASSTLSNTLTRPWLKGEWLIAIALDVHPQRSGPPVTSIPVINVNPETASPHDNNRQLRDITTRAVSGRTH